MERSIQKWRGFLASSSLAAEWANGGHLFNPPGAWPDRWPEDWPSHVHPIYLHRAFGATNRLTQAAVTRPLKRWANREGLPELMAYVAGVPLPRKQEARARRGARQMLQAPQFLIWAYNVPVWNFPRTDGNPLLRDQALYHLTEDPLATEDEHVLQALPLWLLDPDRLVERRGTFNPLRTRASDYVRYEEDELLGWKGPHLAKLPPPRPDPAREGHQAAWPKFRQPLYLTGRVPWLS